MRSKKQAGQVSLVVLLMASSAFAGDAGSAFTYQGQLSDNGAAANGVYDFQFRLFSGEFPFGFAVGSPVVVEDLQVVDGLFTARIDFGNQYPGSERWLDIAVRPGASSGTFTILSPRQELTPAPYAAGLALPYSAQYPTSAALFALDQSGTGPAMSLTADTGNALSAFTSAGGKGLYAQTTGGGIPIYGYNLGATGQAAFFRSESVSNPSPAIEAQNNGTGAGLLASARLGSAGVFQITNPPSNGRAIDASTAGNGDAMRAAITNENSAANALWSKTSGLGRAGLFEISNFNSTANALEAWTNGTGRAAKFVGDVQVVGDLEVDGALYAEMGGQLNRGTPIAYGRFGHDAYYGSDNLDFEFLGSDGDSATYRVKVNGETAPSLWTIIATVSYSDPENPTQHHEVRVSPADAQGRFKIHLQCTANCDVFSQQTYGVNFVVYKP